MSQATRLLTRPGVHHRQTSSFFRANGYNPEDFRPKNGVQTRHQPSRLRDVLQGFSRSPWTWIALLILATILVPSHYQDADQLQAHVAAKSRHHKELMGDLGMPSLAQRKEVLDIMTGLSPKYTKKCMRGLDPRYVQAVHDRYSILEQRDQPEKRSWRKHKLFKNLLKRADRTDVAAEPEPARSASHKYFLALNLYNAEDVIPDLLSLILRLSAYLGMENVYFSVYENSSVDSTKATLRLVRALLESIGLRVAIRTSERQRNKFHHRIQYLAEVRNAAFAPMFELKNEIGETFDTVIFFNDVLPCLDDVLELIWQSRTNQATLTCGADYMFLRSVNSPVFYDNWVTRDINGTAPKNEPFESIFEDTNSRKRFQEHAPYQVQCCWNGIAVMDAKPFYPPHNVRFRMADLDENECSASECSILCNDFWQQGYGRIMMVPRVKLAYDKKTFDVIHPVRRDIDHRHGFNRLGGAPRKYGDDPQDLKWYCPHDRLFTEAESTPIDFKKGPEHVWCWGWDGAGYLSGPDKDPVWEAVKPPISDSVAIRGDRGLPSIQKTT